MFGPRRAELHSLRTRCRVGHQGWRTRAQGVQKKGFHASSEFTLSHPCARGSTPLLAIILHPLLSAVYLHLSSSPFHVVFYIAFSLILLLSLPPHAYTLLLWFLFPRQTRDRERSPRHMRSMAIIAASQSQARKMTRLCSLPADFLFLKAFLFQPLILISWALVSLLMVV